MMDWMSASFCRVSASKRRVRFGVVFEARTAAHVASSNLIRTPSMVRQSYSSVKCETSFLTMANFLSSGQWALNSGVVKVLGRSLKAWERGVCEFERIWQILAAARRASSKPYQPCPKNI